MKSVDVRQFQLEILKIYLIAEVEIVLRFFIRTSLYDKMMQVNALVQSIYV